MNDSMEGKTKQNMLSICLSIWIFGCLELQENKYYADLILKPVPHFSELLKE